MRSTVERRPPPRRWAAGLRRRAGVFGGLLLLGLVGLPARGREGPGRSTLADVEPVDTARTRPATTALGALSAARPGPAAPPGPAPRSSRRDAPGADAPGADAPGADAPATDASGTGASGTDASDTDAPGAGVEAGGAHPAPALRGAGEGTLLDATVAMLGEQLITRSDLIFEARVRALAQQGPVGLSRPVDSSLLARTLEASLLGHLLAQEAERLGVPPLTEAEKQTELGLLEAQAGGPALLDAFLARHGADRAQLLGLIERWEQASRALEVRVRVRAQVTEAEIREAHVASGSTRPYAEERERLSRELRQTRSRAVAARERARLMESASIRRLAPWARADAGDEGAEAP